MLTHANLIADGAGTCALLTDWNPGDRHISYLPLAHIYERNNVTVTVHLGGSIGFYSGNVQELLDDVLVSFLAALMQLWRVVSSKRSSRTSRSLHFLGALNRKQHLRRSCKKIHSSSSSSRRYVLLKQARWQALYL